MGKSSYSISEVEKIIEKAFNSGYQYAYYSQLLGKADTKSEIDKITKQLLKVNK
jgi:hypothetical protein